MLRSGRIRADLGAVDLQTLEPSRVPDKTLITFFVDLEIGPVIVVTPGKPATPGNATCEPHHGRLRVSGRTRRQRTVTPALRSVKKVPARSKTDLDPPSVFDDRPVDTRIDGLFDLLTRPIGVSLIPSTDRGQVLFTPSAGGVL